MGEEEWQLTEYKGKQINFFFTMEKTNRGSSPQRTKKYNDQLKKLKSTNKENEIKKKTP